MKIHIPETDTEGKLYKNILIVEDDIDDQELISEGFAEVDPNCKLTFFKNGRILINLLQTFPDTDLPALIVLDYNMPELNGIETLKILSLDERFKDIPKVLYSTSATFNHNQGLYLSLNTRATIKKGFTTEEIKENIRQMLTYCA
jgi:CheY-like chemotaxis protein